MCFNSYLVHAFSLVNAHYPYFSFPACVCVFLYSCTPSIYYPSVSSYPCTLFSTCAPPSPPHLSISTYLLLPHMCMHPYVMFNSPCASPSLYLALRLLSHAPFIITHIACPHSYLMRLLLLLLVGFLQQQQHTFYLSLFLLYPAPCFPTYPLSMTFLDRPRFRSPLYPPHAFYSQTRILERLFG